MLKPFWKILPVFLIEILAKRFCERLRLDKITVTQPFKDVLIIIEKDSI